MDTRDLKGHMAVKHGAPKAYKCKLCDEAFPYNNMLKKSFGEISPRVYINN